MPDGAGAGGFVEAEGVIETMMTSGTRHAHRGVLTINPPGEPAMRITLEPWKPFFQMRGIGYGTPGWAHGTYKGEHVVEREQFKLADLDPADPPNFHVQAVSRAVLEQEGRSAEIGVGIFEQLIIGAYPPLGLDTAAAVTGG